PTRAARLLACHPGRPQPPLLSELLLSASPLAIFGTTPGRLRRLAFRRTANRAARARSGDRHECACRRLGRSASSRRTDLRVCARCDRGSVAASEAPVAEIFL